MYWLMGEWVVFVMLGYNIVIFENLLSYDIIILDK